MLFDRFSNSILNFASRIVMAPMTRCRSDHHEGIANELMVEYYRQRASAGLIISEGLPVSERARGYINTPGMYTSAQAASWQKVTAAVHGEGGKIFAQLWHCGRIAHSALHADGSEPAGASAIAAQTKTFILGPDDLPKFEVCEAPLALTTGEVGGVVQEFAQAARLAKSAGFDGVEIHGANGYLLDQFRCPYLNDRKDEYGGSLANRYRLLLEVADAVSAVYPPACIAVRQSPYGVANDIQTDPEPLTTYPFIAGELHGRGIGFLHLYDQGTGWIHQADQPLLKSIRAAYKGAVIACGGFNKDNAESLLTSGDADLIAFGKPFIANPDLPARMRRGDELAAWDLATFYAGGDAKGYTDYPLT